MKNLLLLSFLVLSFGSVMALEEEGKDCKTISQASDVKTGSEGTEVVKPVVKDAAAI